jgi:predicted amidophosphoribosyltransferase
LKFLYKIWSGYDGFTPRQIPKRLHGRKILSLGWGRYIDSVEEGHEVWVYFHGPRVSPFGVYAKGFVQAIDTEANRVDLRLRDYSVDAPLTDGQTSDRIAGIIKARGLQVFVYPEVWDTPPECNVDLTAESCHVRRCESCATWKRLPLIERNAHVPPRRFPADAKGFAAAYWVIPPRCYLHYEGRTIAKPVERTSELFYRFKSGESNLAYPLALGIYHALRQRRRLEFDCIVPIPLSPDKAAKSEIHRTRLLAQELAPLLDARVDELLELSEPISKHRLRVQAGLTANQFERLYYERLSADSRVQSYERLLLIDDVSTEGSTIRCALRRIRVLNPKAEIVAATAGQMIMKHVVANDAAIVRR